MDHPGALVVFNRQDADTGRPNSLTFREYADLRVRTSSFVGLIAHSSGEGSFQVGLMLECGTPVALGAAVGIAATLAVSRLLSRLLFGLDAADPTTIGAAVLVLGLATAAAAFLPARRASRTDPLIALRAE